MSLNHSVNQIQYIQYIRTRMQFGINIHINAELTILSLKLKLTTVGIRCVDNATPSTRKRWH
jgi:hypothetical protein